MNGKKCCGKVVIIGSGFVGASAAFTLAMGNFVNEIVMIDINEDKAMGDVLDINHGMSFIGSLSIRVGEYRDVKDADVIIITAGSARKPGESRLDLAMKNDSIARNITNTIMQYYTRGVILVISNPVDILTYIIQKESGLPSSKVISSGSMLDTSRFRFLLSDYFNIDISNVNAFMIGEHGDSMVPVWSHVNIAGISLKEYEENTEKEIDKYEMEEAIRTSGAKIIQYKGATYYAIAIIISRIVQAIIKNENTVLVIGSVVDGPYGLRNVSLSLPSIVNAEGIGGVVEIDLSVNEEEKLTVSAGKLRDFLDRLRY